MKTVNINGVTINTDAPEIKALKSEEDVEKLGLFNHFNDNAKKVSTQKLLDHVSKLGTSEDEGKEEKIIASTTPSSVPNTGDLHLKDEGE